VFVAIGPRGSVSASDVGVVNPVDRDDSPGAEGQRENTSSLHKLLNSLKARHYPWMYDVSKCVTQEALATSIPAIGTGGGG
jgi:hypothetical protein